MEVILVFSLGLIVGMFAKRLYCEVKIIKEFQRVMWRLDREVLAMKKEIYELQNTISCTENNSKLEL